jgi:dephospho-CoA kinase
MAFTVGLTGGIASGKSYVAAGFQQLGVPLLDADIVSREVVAPPSPVLERIAERFGRSMLKADGTLDRAALRALVFADPQALRDLEALTHPAIRERIRQWLNAQTSAYCVVANAILIESGMDALVDRVLVVDAPRETQLARLLRRDAIDAAAAQRMLAAQVDRAARLARAHDVLDNSNDGVDLEAAIERLHSLYTRLGTTG